MKAGELSKEFFSKYDPDEVCKSEPLKPVRSPYTEDFLLAKIVREEDVIEGKVYDDDDDDDVCCTEDQVFDVMSLRRMVKIERRRGDEALVELEKERMAAASAAEEAMAMILRLQNEKSSIESQSLSLDSRTEAAI